MALVERLTGRALPPVEPDELLATMEQVNPLLVKPPFTPPGIARSSIRWAAWFAARQTDLAGALFRRVMASSASHLVFKEVDFVSALPTFQSFEIPVAYVLRDPRAVVASIVKGAEAGLMPSVRRNLAADILARRSPELFDRFADEINTLTDPAVEALIWRVDNDEAVRLLADDPASRIFFYERLVSDPRPELALMLSVFGLEPSAAVDDFLRASSSGPSLRTRLSYGEIGVKPYFSTFRDPAQSLAKWHQQLSPEDLAGISRVLADSVAWQMGVAESCWRPSPDHERHPLGA